jgi:hypothetical protein
MGVYEVGEARGAMMLFLKKSRPQCPETLPVFDFLEWKPEIGGVDDVAPFKCLRDLR